MAEVDSDSSEAANSPSSSTYTTPPETPICPSSPSMLSPVSDFLGLLQSEMNTDLSFPFDLRNLPSPPQPKATNLPFTSPAFSPAIHNSPTVHIMLFEPNSALVRKAPGLPGVRRKLIRPSMNPADLSLIDALGEEARSSYKRLRQDPVIEIRHEAHPPPEALERRYESLVDARNALALRQSVSLTEMGQFLEQVAIRLALYEDDEEIIGSLNCEMDSVENDARRFDLPFDLYDAEFHRDLVCDRGPSFTEKNRQTVSKVDSFLGSTRPARAAASQFLTDPLSLRDHRLWHHFPQ